MAKVRLIPKLQMKLSSHSKKPKMVLVTTVNFTNTIEIGDPVSQAKIYEAQAADELIFLDLDAQMHSHETLVDVIRRAAEEIFMPFTVGGGVKTVDDFRFLLANGADKVSINTAALENSTLIQEAADQFGSQCVVVSIDYKRSENGTYQVYSNNGRQKTGWDPVRWSSECEKRGAGELLLTSIDRDGTRQGLDLELTRAISNSVSIPLITSGGCGLAQHFVDGFKLGCASAIAAGTFFCFKDQNPMQTRSHVKNAGIPIRTLT